MVTNLNSAAVWFVYSNETLNLKETEAATC